MIYPQEQIKLSKKTCQVKLARVELALVLLAEPKIRMSDKSICDEKVILRLISNIRYTVFYLLKVTKC